VSVAEAIDETVVQMTRTFDAPRERVFAAWTEAEQLARWFAPEGFSVAACETVPGAGGAFRMCLRSAEGRDYWIRGEYRSVEPPAHLQIACIAEDREGRPHLEELIDVTLERQRGARTTLRLRASARAMNPEAVATARGMPEMWARTVLRLHSHLGRKN
jgi:uncharacterized protein YndB with AHSA1/START domain